jgi:hypothetical protein
MLLEFSPPGNEVKLVELVAPVLVDAQWAVPISFNFPSATLSPPRKVVRIRNLSGHCGSLEVFFRYVYIGNFNSELTTNLFTESNLWKE